jgi:hypothetical protein
MKIEFKRVCAAFEQLIIHNLCPSKKKVEQSKDHNNL